MRSPAHLAGPAVVTAPRPRGATVIPWSKLPSAQIAQVRAPHDLYPSGTDGSTFPRRPYLELAGAPAGWAGRVMHGDGSATALAVRVGARGGVEGAAGGCVGGEAQVISVGDGAQEVSARTDGVWVKYRARLAHLDERGETHAVVALEGAALAAAALVGVDGDAAWLGTAERAWHVSPGGRLRGPYARRVEPGRPAFAVGPRLCGRARGRTGAISCLAPDGVSEIRTLGFRLSPGEEPLTLVGAAVREVLTAQGRTLRRWRGGELVDEQRVQAVGVDAGWRSFAMSAVGAVLVLGRQDGDAAMVGARFPSVAGGELASAAIEGGLVTLYGQGRMARHRGAAPGAVVAEAVVDEEAYRHAIFPSTWTISPRGAVAAAGCGSGEPVLGVATSGPEGVAIVPLSLTAR